MAWEFKLEPTAEEVSEIEHILDVGRNVWNFALRERKDWLDSRKSPVNACSIWQEFILPADAPFLDYPVQAKRLTVAKADFPRLKTVNAQVLQPVIRKREISWESGLGQFTHQILPWVCFKRDVFYGQVDARGTSQECPDCGAEVRKDLSPRIHHCHHCGSVKPRDVAAGQVIAARGQRGG